MKPINELRRMYPDRVPVHVEITCKNINLDKISKNILSFNLNHITEPGFDRLTFEASTDGGVTWNVVNAGGVNPTNWFTTGAPFWEGTSGGWIPVENV